MLPGTLEEHYNVCGKAQCRCKDKTNPKKHGPYHRLSYNLRGKNSSISVKKEDAAAVKEMTDNYREARSNMQELSLSMVALYRENGLQDMLCKHNQMVESEKCRQKGEKPISRTMLEACSSRDKWKTKALERQAEISRLSVNIRDVENSRDKWKARVAELTKEKEELKKLILSDTVAGKKK